MRPGKLRSWFVINIVPKGNPYRFPSREMDSKNILLVKDVSSIFSCGRLKQMAVRAH